MVQHRVFSSSCAILCAMNFECISFNYCSRLKCILNTKDIFSRDVISDDDPHCDYHGMDRPTTPSCVERGEEKLIITDGYPYFCRVNKKRQDAEWNEWEDYVEIDTSEEWKFVKFRTCHLASHGGIEQCVTTESKVTEWVRFLQYLTNWNNANGACQANGGNLLNKFDGTREQIEFFFQKLGKPSCFWVGLFLENGQWLLWPSYESVNWDLIVWGTNQPGNEGLLEYKSAG